MANKKEKLKVYLSGPVSSRDIKDVLKDFNGAELYLTGLGYDVVNPITYDRVKGESLKKCMRHDLKLLCDCNRIYLLKGWETSKEARLEYNVAFELGITPVYY